jgi:HEAT repeat protein
VISLSSGVACVRAVALAIVALLALGAAAPEMAKRGQLAPAERAAPSTQPLVLLTPANPANRPAVDALFGACRDRDPNVQHAAFDALIQHGTDAVPALLGALRAEQTRRIGIEGFARLGWEAVAALLPSLADADAGVRAAAAEALSQAIRSERQFFPPSRSGPGYYRTSSRIEPPGPPGVPDLAAVMGIELRQAREKAVAAGLAQACRDGDLAVRTSAVGAMAKLAAFGTEVDVVSSALVAAASDDAVAVRLKAVEGLSEMVAHAGSAVRALAEALRDPDRAVRRAAAQSLRVAGPAAQPAVGALIQALKDPDPQVRASAVAALGQARVRPVGTEATLQAD